jgi:hypothetical protein
MTENNDTQPETVEINKRELQQFILTISRESNDWEVYVPEHVEEDDVWDGVSTRNVDYVKSEGGIVEVGGSFIVKEVVDYIKASGGGRFEPPTNPPEVVTEDREAHFVIRFTFEDLGFSEGLVEVA